MRTPIRPLPRDVAAWTTRARYLRWADALVGFVAAWIVVTLALPNLSADARILVVAMIFGGLAALPRARAGWRPLSAVVATRMSAALRPGDQAWYVVPGEAHLVLVTGRRGLRIVVAGGIRGETEGYTVRRTQALLIPAEPERRAPR